jgi:hypothetical protein
MTMSVHWRQATSRLRMPGSGNGPKADFPNIKSQWARAQLFNRGCSHKSSLIGAGLTNARYAPAATKFGIAAK